MTVDDLIKALETARDESPDGGDTFVFIDVGGGMSVYRVAEDDDETGELAVSYDASGADVPGIFIATGASL